MKPLDLAIPDHAVEQAGPAGALARFEYGSHQRKQAGGLHQQPGRLVRHALLVQFREPPFEIIVHQRDRQIGRTLDDVDAEIAQRRTQLRRPLHVDGFDEDTAVLEVLLRYVGRQAEACPIAGDRPIGGLRPRHDIAPLDQPLEGFLDLVGRIFPSQLANEFRSTLSAFADGLGKRAIELAMKEEFPVLGIKADDIGRQHIGGEIRRELQRVVAWCAASRGSCWSCCVGRS